jgi:hypothetical protein
MGTQLIRQVETLGLGGRLTHLGNPARLCLYVMALNAHDTGTKTVPARIYFRGWEHLARTALGRDEYDHAAECAVGRAIAELVAAGLVKPVGRRNGNRRGATLYELLLW